MPVAPTDATVDGVINGVSTQFVNNGFQSGVDYLGWWLDKASDDWFNNTGETLQSVDLVTHSTGGLVARAYIQSDAYDDANAIKIDDLVLAGVPSEGTSSVYNLLHNDFSDKPASRILGKVIDKAWDLMWRGEDIIARTPPLRRPTIPTTSPGNANLSGLRRRSEQPVALLRNSST